MRWIRIVLPLLFLFLTVAANGQLENTSKRVVVLFLNNGEQLIGPVVSETDQDITILYQQKERLFRKSAIRKVEEAEPGRIIRGRYVFPTPHPTGYFTTTNAFTMGESKIGIHSSYFALHELQLGLRENLDFSVGSSFVGSPITLGIKQHFEVLPSLHVGIKGSILWSSWIDPSFLTGGVQLVLTNGDRERNFTFAPGIGGALADDTFTGILYTTLGGKVRVSERISLSMEGLYGREINATNLFGIFYGVFGVQYHRTQHVSWLLGGGIAGVDEYFYPVYGIPQRDSEVIPMINVSYRRTF